MQKAAVMIHGTKNEEFFLLFVPVAAQTAENGCAIIERMGRHTDLRLRIGDDLTLKKSVLWKIHRHTSGLGFDAALFYELIILETLYHVWDSLHAF